MKYSPLNMEKAVALAQAIASGKAPKRAYTEKEVNDAMKKLAVMIKEVEANKAKFLKVHNPKSKSIDRTAPKADTKRSTPPKPVNSTQTTISRKSAPVAPKTPTAKAKMEDEPRTLRPKMEHQPTGSRMLDKPAKANFLKKAADWLHKR